MNDEINVDTTKMFECGNDIVRLANEYNEVLNTLTNRFNKLSSTGEWMGISALQFTNRFKNEKKEYEALGEILYDLGKNLLSSAESINRTIVENTLDLN